MATEEMVQPKDPSMAAPAPAPDPAAAPAPEESDKSDTTGASGLPDDLLKIPAIQAVFAGSPPAVSAPITEFSKVPEAKLIVKHKDQLLAAGMGFYKSLAGDTGVLFNQLHIHGDDLKAADQAGQLAQIAPSFDQINGAVAKSGANHPVLNAKVPTGAKAPTPQGAPQINSPGATQMAPQAAPKPPAAAAQRKLMTARVSNMQPGAPTSGPQPGAGRILNSILKPVI